MPEKRNSLLFFLLTEILLFSACANIVSPSGGPADNTPPRVASEKPANGSTNFSGRKIEICFNEFVSPQETEKNISISPPLNIKPQINFAGRCIEVELDRAEVLHPNTTYTINFGNAISDLNEANALHDFSYSFSTGPFIDSFYVGGQVTSAFNGQKIAGFTAGLYDSICDSCLQKAKPLYVARADENGFFRIKRVKEGRYWLAGFKDDNSNGMANPGELTAFHPQPIYVSDSNQSLNISAYKSALYKRNSIIDTLNPCKGAFALVFYRPEKELTFKANSYFARWVKAEDFDTLYLYNKNPEENLQFNYSLDKTDRNLIYPNKASKLCNLSLSAEHSPDSFLLRSSNPVRSVLRDSILVKYDTLLIRELKISRPDSFSVKIQLAAGFKPGRYQLLTGEGALVDIYGQKSKPEFYPALLKGPEEFGSIELKIKNEQKRKIILQLVDDKDRMQREVYIHNNKDIKMERLLPGTYRIKLIEDINNNGKWDEGDTEMRIMPEKVFYFSTVFKLRADWEFENNPIDIESFKW